MKPTIGSVVHYQQVCAYGPDTPPEILARPLPLLTRAAIVTGIKEVAGESYPVLRILCDHPSQDFVVDCSPGGYQREGVSFSEVPKMGCWNWPPREPTSTITIQPVFDLAEQDPSAVVAGFNAGLKRQIGAQGSVT